ncbi:hypothetical protein DFH06DRAFT_1144970 [Mycena polygramma]|nr:hypothetical protein DFH06DRAFT_1144970 [Mycena polygramma]
MSKLIDHVCGFPLLESLYIGGSARHFATVRPLSKEPPPKLRTLIISDPVFADWLLSLDPVPKQISTIVLRDIKLPHQWLAINEYLTSAAGMAIRSLTFPLSLVVGFCTSSKKSGFIEESREPSYFKVDLIKADLDLVTSYRLPVYGIYTVQKLFDGRISVDAGFLVASPGVC